MWRLNLLHMKYALEIARCGSINKAAEVLLMNQPNLSRAMKELEQALGVKIFSRSAKGMVPTPEGETFLNYAGSILKQTNELENMFRTEHAEKKRFSVSVPRASYISEAFAGFSLAINHLREAEIIYKETNAQRAIRNILEEDYKLGIIRYAEYYDKYYKEMLEERGLSYELITEFSYVLLLNENSELAKQEKISFADLERYIEIAHADPFVPSLPFADVKKEELTDNISRRIFVFERASQFELLAQNPDTFMWVSPVPSSLLQRYGLVQKICSGNTKRYKDVMLHRKNYHLSELDNLFISELCKAKREIFS